MISLGPMVYKFIKLSMLWPVGYETYVQFPRSTDYLCVSHNYEANVQFRSLVMEGKSEYMNFSRHFHCNVGQEWSFLEEVTF